MQATKIPLNQEHAEAAQAEIDRKRAAIKAEMTEDERSNLELIEKVSQELKQANIPFVLFAGPYKQEKTSFFQFNWLCTEGAEDIYSEKARMSLSKNINSFIAACHYYIGGFGYFIGMLPPKK